MQGKVAAVRMARNLRADLAGSTGRSQWAAEQLGHGVESIHLWVKQADTDAGHSPEMRCAEGARNRNLEQVNRELRRVDEVLDRAACFFESIS